MKTRILLICLVLASLLSCTRQEVLRKADSLIKERPDSALTLLEAFPREDLRSDAAKAEYDYLSAIAFYNTYYFLDDAHAASLASAYRFKEQARMRSSNLALLIAAIMATLVLYFWARNIQAQKQLILQMQENEKVLSAAEELKSRLGAAQKKDSVTPFDTLDRLCEQYYIYEGTENLQPKIIKEVRSIVEGLRSDPAVQKELEQSLNKRHDGVMTRLKSAYPKWRDEDYLLYMFAASGFSSTTISTLLEKDKPYVYNRLYRLKERIKSSDTTDRALFLACLEK
ncbi:MAG: hypothetical protein J5669_02015 [Bacteroidales bacterium]|nr:hypothetical protein [Bacteroidales bacterium]